MTHPTLQHQKGKRKGCQIPLKQLVEEEFLTRYKSVLNVKLICLQRANIPREIYHLNKVSDSSNHNIFLTFQAYQQKEIK